MVWPGETTLRLGPAEVVFTTDPVREPSKTPLHELSLVGSPVCTPGGPVPVCLGGQN